MWMVTYGDLMSLLLCFFVLLLSFSTISEKKVSQAIQSLQGALGVLPKNRSVMEVRPIPRMYKRAPRSKEKLLKQAKDIAKQMAKMDKDMQRAAREIMKELQIMDRAEDVKTEFNNEGGLNISLPSKVLFDTAQADLKAEAFPVLEEVGKVLADIPEAIIEVIGHTDSRPLTRGGKFEDNDHLSYARAKSVSLFLSERSGIAREKIEIVACGPWQPKETNDTEEGMQANRRVDIKVRGMFSQEVSEGVYGSFKLLEKALAEYEQGQ